MLLEEQLCDLQRAYEEQAKEVSSWRGQCLYLQDAFDKSKSPLEMQGNAESVQGLSTRKEHYRPKRGVQISELLQSNTFTPKLACIPRIPLSIVLKAEIY